MCENILKLDHVSKSFANAGSSVTNALEDIDMGIRSGEFISVIGPSGCGKSTILRLIAGLIVPTTRKVPLNGGIIDGLALSASPHQSRIHGLSIVGSPWNS